MPIYPLILEAFTSSYTLTFTVQLCFTSAWRTSFIAFCGAGQVGINTLDWYLSGWMVIPPPSEEKREGCLEGGCWHMDYFEPKTFENQQMWPSLTQLKTDPPPALRKRKNSLVINPFPQKFHQPRKMDSHPGREDPRGQHTQTDMVMVINQIAHPDRRGHKCKSPLCSPKGPFIFHQNHLLSRKRPLSPSFSHSDDP